MDKEILEILKRLEIRQNETYQIVKALEHSAEINKVEHEIFWCHPRGKWQVPNAFSTIRCLSLEIKWN